MLEMNPSLDEVSHDIFKALLIFSCANSSFLLVLAWLQKMCYFKKEKNFRTQRNRWMWENYDGNQKLKDFGSVACTLFYQLTKPKQMSFWLETVKFNFNQLFEGPHKLSNSFAKRFCGFFPILVINYLKWKKKFILNANRQVFKF